MEANVLLSTVPKDTQRFRTNFAKCNVKKEGSCGFSHSITVERVNSITWGDKNPVVVTGILNKKMKD